MHGPKSCGKNPKATPNVILPIGSKECSDRLFRLLLGTRLSSLSHPKSGNWRIIFRMFDDQVELVDYLDYH